MKFSKKAEIALLALAALLCLCSCTNAKLDVKLDDCSLHAGDSLDDLRQYLTVTYTNTSGVSTVVTDYTLDGQLTEGDCTVTVGYGGLTADVTVRVLPVQPQMHTVTFVADGAIVATEPFAEGDASVTEPAVPNKIGYTGSWQQYVLGTADITVNAVYAAKSYLVQLDTDGGSVQPDQITFTFDQAVGDLPQPVKPNFEFAGWWLDDEPIESDTVWRRDGEGFVLRAKWTPIDGKGTAQQPYTVAEALQALDQLPMGGYSDGVYVQGVVWGVGDDMLMIVDNDASLNVFGAQLLDGIAVVVGDTVTVYGYLSGSDVGLTSYGEDACRIVSHLLTGYRPDPDGGTRDDPYSVQDACMLTEQLPAGGYSDRAVYVKGKVAGTLQAGKYSGYRFLITDNGARYFTVYYADIPQSMLDMLTDGDVVVVYGYLYRYVNSSGETLEISSHNGVQCQVVALDKAPLSAIEISVGHTELYVGESVDIYCWTTPLGYANSVTYIVDGGCSVEDGKLYAVAEGVCTLQAVCGDIASNIITVTVRERQQQLSEIKLSVLFNLVYVGSSLPITCVTTPSGFENAVNYIILLGSECGYIADNMFVATAAGEAVIVAELDGVVSNQITLTVSQRGGGGSVSLAADETMVAVGGSVRLTAKADSSLFGSVDYRVVSGDDCAYISGSTLYASQAGLVGVAAFVGNVQSNIVYIEMVDNDPYVNAVPNWFHSANYKTASSAEDAYWRTQHNLMSGDLSDQDQHPTVAANQPKYGSSFVRNSNVNYIDNGNGWQIVDSSGKVVDVVYRYGAYVTLEEVAAYVYAYGNVPANYNASTSASPSGSPWGEWLRLNNNYFSGDTARYPYEPILPNISGIGGTYDYYEIDIGTTGTDCDPNYPAAKYNTGSRITRGAARIVYARYDGDGNLLSPSDRYVFYTYNHYNDFQEYLNYQGGWGEMFGNVTGGGTLSSRYNYNPTDYVPVVMQQL